MKHINSFVFGTIMLFVSLSAYAKTTESFGNVIVNNAISAEEVQSMQEAWGAALLKISRANRESGLKKATSIANEVLDTAYGYNMGPVLFKPTLANGDQTFRTTKEGALAYFVGGNKKFASDKGFALKKWEKYQYKNAAVYINGDMALTMGHVILVDSEGKTTTVDKTWGFKKDLKGNLRIVLHHSSLPYSP